MKRDTRSRIKVVIAIGVFLGLFLALFVSPAEGPQTITYTEFLTALDDGKIESIHVLPDSDIQGTWKVPVEGEDDVFSVSFRSRDTEALFDRAEAVGVSIAYRGDPPVERFVRIGGQLLLSAIYIFLLVFLVRYFRTMQKPAGRLAEGVRTTFADVAGTQGAADELREVVDFMKNRSHYDRLGATSPRGVLLVGPPGTGKTLMARAVAGEAGVKFRELGGSETTGFLVGLGAQRVRAVFEEARKEGGVIFIDEIDTMAAKRGRNMSHNEDERTLTQLLQELDGFDQSGNVVVLAATNRVDILDEALTRPGRFDRIVYVGNPTVRGREEILQLHINKRGVPLGDDVDLKRLAKLTPGSSGAVLENLINEAAIAAGRDKSPTVNWEHFETARDRSILGRERPGFMPSLEEVRAVAYHEAGHAITGLLYTPEETLHKVTIRPRGEALGVAHFSPREDRSLYRKDSLEGQLVKALGGRAAEEVVFGPERVTSGAASDLEQANRIARTMVSRFGMGTKAGLLVISDTLPPLSDEMRALFEREAGSLLDTAMAEARECLRLNRDVLVAIAEELLDHETLDASVVHEIIERNGGLERS